MLAGCPGTGQRGRGEGPSSSTVAQAQVPQRMRFWGPWGMKRGSKVWTPGLLASCSPRYRPSRHSQLLTRAGWVRQKLSGCSRPCPPALRGSPCVPVDQRFTYSCGEQGSHCTCLPRTPVHTTTGGKTEGVVLPLAPGHLGRTVRGGAEGGTI